MAIVNSRIRYLNEDSAAEKEEEAEADATLEDEQVAETELIQLEASQLEFKKSLIQYNWQRVN